jgi:non-homologous end joining protein Ku
VDAETEEEVPYEKIVRGYEVGKGQYIEVTDDQARDDGRQLCAHGGRVP